MSLTEHRPTTEQRVSYLVPAVFVVTIFLSAALLFFVQPLFTKLVLPRMGGAPAVWTTAMLFFQVVLLIGYIYAHVLTRLVPTKAQLAVHLLIWAAALFFLPLSISPDWTYDPSKSTVLQTMSLFMLGVGMPFAVLSANAPLLQAWYATSGGPSANDPYFLYGASNLGSLIALMGFPLVAEPLFGATDIGSGWAIGFVVFGGLLLASGVLAIRGNSTAVKPRQLSANNQSSAPSYTDILTWLFLAFVPSSLMLSVTSKVSTDLGSLPLIWVVPLSLYILSFVVTFSKKPVIGPQTSSILALISLAVMAVTMSDKSDVINSWIMGLLLAPALFSLCVEAHRRLYDARPTAAHLTVFYIVMSVGGALGGLFNSIIAPFAFTDVYEGTISVSLAALIFLSSGRHISMRIVACGVLVAVAASLMLDLGGAMFNFLNAAWIIVAVALVLAIALISLRRTPAAIATAVVLFLGIGSISVNDDLQFKDRSFFGTHKVFEENGVRVYANGTTIHGMQFVDEGKTRPTPLSYYYPDSPMAQVLTFADVRPDERIGIVGLGVGSLACYARPGQTWEFYEIDEMVDKVARDPTLFSFMSECALGSRTHLGDARIVLESQSVEFDILVLDAYSSDAIPVHLVTREAVELYQRRLTHDGIMVFHISNRYYDLSQPLARIADLLGLHAVIQSDFPSDEKAFPEGARPSVVMAMSRSAAKVDKMVLEGDWTPIVGDGRRAWTDDHANLLSALK